MINNVTLVGRLTRDPEVRYTTSNLPYSKFTIAVNRMVRQGSKPESDFINCVAWRGTAENLAKYMSKGKLIGLTGRIETNSYENNQGQKVNTVEVVVDNIQFLERGNTQENNQSQYQQQQGQAPLGTGDPYQFMGAQSNPFNQSNQFNQMQQELEEQRETVTNADLPF